MFSSYQPRPVGVKGTVVNITQYDNKYTLMYKYAEYFGEPVDWMVSVYPSQYTSVVHELINRETATGYTDIVKELTGLFNYNEYFKASIKPTTLMYDIVRYISRMTTTMQFSQGLNNFTSKVLIDLSVSTGVIFPSTNPDSISGFVATMNTNYDLSMVVTKERLKIINEYTDKVNEVNSMERLLKVGKEEPVFKTFQYNFKGVKPGSGMGIFYNLVLSERLTYVYYIDTDLKEYRKVYEGIDLGRNIDMKYSIIERPRGRRPGSMQLTFWLGAESVYDALAGSFFQAFFDLKEGRLTCKVPISVRDIKLEYAKELDDVVHKAFNFLILTGMKEKSRVVEVNMYPAPGGEEFREFALLHQVLLSPMFKYMFYASESHMPFARKRRFELYYVPFMSELFYASSRDELSLPVKWSLAVKSFTGKVYDDTYENQSIYLRVRLSNAKSASQSKEIINNISNALRLHLASDVIYPSSRRLDVRVAESLFSTDRDLLPEIKVSIPKKDTDQDLAKGAIVRENFERAKRLIAAYPNVFGSRYIIDCPPSNVPEVFRSEAEAILWIQSTTWGEKPLPYPAPPAAPLFWFTGANEDYRYPSVVESSDPVRKFDYPYVPKCTSSNPGSNAILKMYYGNVKASRGTSTTISVSDKFLKRDERGESPLSLKRLLQIDTLLREGTSSVPDNNSFIHCVMRAVNDVGYVSTLGHYNDESRTSAYVSDFRNRCSKDERVIQLVRQELYDMDTERIKAMIVDNSIFFDPSFFYRVLEEYFKVNIFVFDNEVTDPLADSNISVPRFRDLHARARRYDRPTVIVFKNYGPRQSRKKYSQPHCELVINVLEGTTTYFQTVVTDICYAALENTTGTATFRFSEGSGLRSERSERSGERNERSERSEPRGYNNIYSLNLDKVFGNSIVSQRIDSHGHARCFNVMFRTNNNLVSVYIPPVQPVLAKESKAIYKTTYNDAVVLIGKQPYSYSLSVRGYADGLWFSYVGVDEFFFIPIVEVTPPQYIRVGSTSLAVTGTGGSPTERLARLRWTLSMIQQLVKWTFDTYRTRVSATRPFVEDPDNDDVYLEDEDGDDDNFMTLYFNFVSEKWIGDTATYYDLSKLKEPLPEYKHETECIAYIATNVPLLVKAGKFSFVDDRFGKGMEYYLRTYFKETFKTDIVPIDHLSGFYTSYLEFKSTPGVQIFLDREEFNEWLSARERNDRNEIRSAIKLSYHRERDPYLVEDKDGRLVLIQNTYHSSNAEQSSLYSSLVVAQSWKETKVNLGYYAVSEPNITVDYALYAISTDGKLVLVRESETDDYVSILVYGGAKDLVSEIEGISRNVRYAAILDL